MEIVLNKDSIKYMGIDSTYMDCDGLMIPCIPLVLSSDSFVVAIVDIPHVYYEVKMLKYIIRLYCDNDAIVIPVQYQSIVSDKKIDYLRFNYFLADIPEKLKVKMNNLLDIKKYQEMRKDERIKITPESLNSLNMPSSIVSFWTQEKKSYGVLQDISFSGLRLFCTDVPELDTDDKIVLSLDFMNPSEMIGLKAVVVRKRLIPVDNQVINEIGCRYINTIPVGYSERVLGYN